MNLARLKVETAAAHSRMESLVPLMSPTLEQDRYRMVLRHFYGFIRSWEVWSMANVPAELRPMLMERERSNLLKADLRYFGEHLPEFLYMPPARDTKSRAAFLGAMYVIEGSTLGGQHIARHVEDILGLSPGQGDSYFRGYGDRTKLMWRQFQEVINAVPDDDADEVITSAGDMFFAFGEWMRHLEPTDNSKGEKAL